MAAAAAKFRLLHIMVIAAGVASTASVLSVRKAGLATSWLKPLRADEIDEIRERCPTANASLALNINIGDSSPHRRLAEDVLADPGQFPHAAVMFDDGGPYCGATLFSRRHLVTAAHCVTFDADGDEEEGKAPSALRLAVGGVCLSKSYRDDEHCPDGDMFEAHVELIAKEFYTSSGGYKYGRVERDVAFIQLREPLPASILSNHNSSSPVRAGFACLPPDDMSPAPLSLVLAGWGHRHSYRTPYHLRYTQGSSRPNSDWYSSSQCDPPAHGREALPASDVCLFGSTLRTLQTVYPGDSGSGVVGVGAPPHVLYGVASLSAPTNVWGNRRHGVSMAVTYHLHDFCYYLSLCTKDARLPVPRLFLSSAYIAVPRRELAPIAPFPMITDAEGDGHAEHCRSLERDLTTPRRFNWVGAVTIDHGSEKQLNCTATLITTSHFVTARSCVVNHLKSVAMAAQKATTITVRLSIETAGGRMLIMQPEFIAWRHPSMGYQERDYLNPNGFTVPLTPHAPDSELAIAQLTETDAKRLQGVVLRPACLELEPNAGGYGGRRAGTALPAFGYRWSGENKDVVVKYPVRMRGKLVSENDTLPSDILLVQRGWADRLQRNGDGLVDKRGHRLLALLGDSNDGNSGRGRGVQPLLRYMHLWEYSGVFCAYLNLNCNGASYIDSRIAFFDRFIYPQ